MYRILGFDLLENGFSNNNCILHVSFQIVVYFAIRIVSVVSQIVVYFATRKVSVVRNDFIVYLGVHIR